MYYSIEAPITLPNGNTQEQSLLNNCNDSDIEVLKNDLILSPHNSNNRY